MKQKTIVLVLMVLLCALANTARAGIDATLKGRVIDARTGEALVGATLQIVQAGQPRSATKMASSCSAHSASATTPL